MKNELTFRTHGFASLPSGTYLFFPVQPDHDREAELAALDAPAAPRRVVLVTNLEAAPVQTFSGVACGSTLYVVLEPAEFNKVLERVSAPGRNSFEKPVKFEFALDQEETLISLAIDGQPLTERRESYTAAVA